MAGPGLSTSRAAGNTGHLSDTNTVHTYIDKLDTTFLSPSDNNVLTYDTASGTYKPEAPTGVDAEGVRDTMAAALVAGSNVTITPNDGADTITIASTGGGGGSSTGILFTADTTGATNVSTALSTQAGTAAAAGVPLIAPPGDYQLTGGVTFPANFTMIGTGDARFFRTTTGNMLILSSNNLIEGVTVECAGSGSAAIKPAANATDITVRRCTLLGGSGAQTFYVDAANVSGIDIDSCHFSGGSYGFLSNSTDATNAYNLRNVRIHDCRFDSFTGDPIEFNHPSSSAPACGDVWIENNWFSNPLGTFVGSGFAIGLAGIDGSTVKGNHILARREGIHYEDDCRNITCSGNTIYSVTGTASNGGIVVYPGCLDVKITDNLVTNVGGKGIWFVYDAGAVHSSNVTIDNNEVRDCTGDGIYFGADNTKGGRFKVTDNFVRTAGGDGIVIVGNPDEIIFHDNWVFDCTGFGVNGSGSVTARLRSYRNNIILNNTGGDYKGEVISSSHGNIVSQRHARLTSAASGASTIAIPLFRLGRSARGEVRIQSRRVAATTNRGESVWPIRWDGTSLAAGPKLGSATNGTMSHDSLSMVDGVLTLNATVGASGIQVEVAAYFDGYAVENGAAFTGTVAGDLMAITGSRGGNAALASLLTKLALMGIITDSSSA